MANATIILVARITAAVEYSEVMLWGAMGFVVVLFLGFVLMWFRRKYHPDNVSADTSALSFSMRSIEEMRDSGAISEDEFRRLRASSLGLAPPTSDNADKDNSALSGPVDVDDAVEELDASDDSQDQKENI